MSLKKECRINLLDPGMAQLWQHIVSKGTTQAPGPCHRLASYIGIQHELYIKGERERGLYC